MFYHFPDKINIENPLCCNCNDDDDDDVLIPHDVRTNIHIHTFSLAFKRCLSYEWIEVGEIWCYLPFIEIVDVFIKENSTR